MTSVVIELFAIVICLLILFLLSLVEMTVIQSSPVALRAIVERDQKSSPPLLAILLEDETHILVPLRMGTQVTLITTAILTTHLSLREWGAWGVGISFVLVFLVSAVFRQLLPGLLTQNNPEPKLVRLLIVFAPLYWLLRSFTFPLSTVLRRYRRDRDTRDAEQNPASGETIEEEIQAYLEIGEDEGIIEKEDSRLIQSVVAFGDTLVREVMTPRTKIIACEDSANVGQLRDIMVQNRHSRIPIYHGDLDHIVGIAYIRFLLAHYFPGRETDAIAPLIHPAPFVPETMKVSALLKDFQVRGINAAIVIDEFGGVNGLVTMEDLLEEIVGEIRDEDQTAASEVVEESANVFLIRGSTELHRLEKLSGRRLEHGESSTVAGLIITFLGRVPAPGEEFDMHGMKIRILDADRRRVHRIRIELGIQTRIEA